MGPAQGYSILPAGMFPETRRHLNRQKKYAGIGASAIKNAAVGKD